MKGSRRIWIGAGLGLAAALAALAFWPGLPAALPGACLLREIWGVPCPGCGMTRALSLLFSGDVAGSIGHHALAVPILLGVVAGVMFRCGLLPVRAGWRLPSGTVFLALLVVLAYHAVRLGEMCLAGTLGESFRSGALFRAASWLAGLV